MPKVIQYQTDQVTQAPIADTRSSLRSTPDDFGAGVGRAVNQLGNTVGKIAVDMQLRENETLAREKFTQFERDIVSRHSNPDTNYFRRSGRDAYLSLDDEKAEVDRLANRYLDETDNPAQRARLGELLNNRKNRLFESYGRHSEKSLLAWENSQNEFAAKTAIESAISNPYSPDVFTNLERGRMEIYALNKRNGASEEEIGFKVDAYENQFHKSMVAAMIQDNPRDARNYYTLNKDDMLADTRVAVEKELESAELLQSAQEQADLIMEKATLEGADPVKLASEITDPDLRKNTESLVRIYQADAERHRKQVERQQSDAAWDAVINDPRPESIPKAVSSTQRMKMLKYIQGVASGKGIDTNWEQYYKLAKMAGDPATRQQFKDLDLNQYRPVLGNAELKSFMNLQAGLAKGDDKTKLKLDELYSNKQVIDGLLKSADIDTNPKVGTDDAKRLAKWRQYIDFQVEQIKAQNGGTIDKRTYLDTVTRALQEVIIDEGSFFDDTKLRFEVDQADIGDVPEADRNEIIAALKTMNQPVTEQNIKAWYFRGIHSGK